MKTKHNFSDNVTLVSHTLVIHTLIGSKIYLLITVSSGFGTSKDSTYLSNGNTEIFIGHKPKQYRAKLKKWHEKALKKKTQTLYRIKISPVFLFDYTFKKMRP